MTTAPLIIVCLTVLAALVVVTEAVKVLATLRSAPAAPAAERGPLADRHVVVHTRAPDAQSVRGVVVSDSEMELVLRDAMYLHAGGGQPADGLVHIPKPISTLQEITVTEQLAAPAALKAA